MPRRGTTDTHEGATLTIVDAFCRAAASCPQLHLDYVGDGSERPAAEDHVRAQHLQHRVRFHGFLPNERVVDLMRRNHIFIHLSQAAQPFRYDTCPVVVTEAMAQSMAIVATRHGGIPEEVIDSESGLLVDEGDARAAAERIVALVRDPVLRNRLSERAWRRATEMFSEEVVYSQWHDLLALKPYAEPTGG